MADSLGVWLYGLRVAVISTARWRLRLEYTKEALANYQLGFPLLSISLPLRPERYSHIPVKAFLDGLLPEGEARRAIARDLGLNSEDTYRLIRELGRDCAGAIIIQPFENPEPPQPTTLSGTPLKDEEIAQLVANLHAAPLGVSARVRISLAGIQEKLLLTRMPDGSWGQPVDGTPSTHILKPEIAAYPNTVENEMFCMRTAKHLGLPAANVEIMHLRGRKLLLIERFDRLVYPDGRVDRLHQEDFCQAFSVLPEQKYEENGGPSLRRIAEVIRAVAPSDSLEVLLRAVTLNVLIGNGDAHAKNFSLLHNPTGQFRFAPLYDLMSTLFYGDDRLAMYIDNVHRTDRVTASRILNEAARWGLPPLRSAEIVRDMIERVPKAAEIAAAEVPDLPPGLLEIVKSQTERVKGDLAVFSPT